jgi:L-iditol 2-dehydrogenase
MPVNSCQGPCVVYYAPQEIRIERRGKPSPGKGEALIQIEACAICGTDIKAYFSGNPRIKPPMVMGHELCGKIVGLGAGVAEYQVGERVTMATTIGCGECRYCRSGKTNLCRKAEAMGFHYPGAMAPYMIVPAKAVRQGHLVAVGDLDPTVAALGEPLSCVINGLSRVPLPEIGSALILGLGPLGMLHALTLRARGVGQICCVEFPGKRFALAEKMGFTVLPPDQIDRSYKELSGNEGFDLVIITAPHNGTQAKAPGYARKGGYVSYFASLPVGDEMVTLNSRTIHYNELILYGTSDSTVAHLQEAVSLLQEKAAEFKGLITHEMPMGEFHRAMEAIKAGEAVKIILRP